MTRRFKRVLALAVATVTLSANTTPAHAAPVSVVPGATWRDTDGNLLQAHGAGFFKVGSSYYMVGEDKTAGSTFTAVACYSSTDLVTWTRHANALSQQASGDLTAGRIVERPKVIYNSATGKYVMWLHIDNATYGDARAGVATSDTPCGPYTYLGSSRPLGQQSRDIGLFKDDDGTAYLLTEDRANGLRIDRLSSDYTSVVSATATLPDYESPAMVKVDGRYFLFGSQLTGWNTNDNVYATATSISGPWSTFKTFAPVGSKTFNSQTSFVLPVTGSSGTTHMYVGDRWNSANLNSSKQIWLPMTISGSTASMPQFYEEWTVDTATGRWSPISFELTGVQSSRCLDITGNTSANGTLMEIWDCNGGENQQWVYTADKELRAFGKTKCLDVLGRKTAPGSPVGIWDCNGGTNQKWNLNPDGTIVGVQSGLCLDVNGNRTASGTAVLIWTCTGSTNQKWTRTS